MHLVKLRSPDEAAAVFLQIHSEFPPFLVWIFLPCVPFLACMSLLVVSLAH